MIPWMRIWKQSPWVWSGLLAGACVVNALAYVWPWVIKVCLDHLGHQQPLVISPMVWAILFSVAVGRFALQIWIKKRTYRLAQEVAQSLRLNIYTQIQNLPLNILTTMPPSNVLTHVATDIESIRRFLSHETIEGAMSVINVVLLMGILWFLNPWLAIALITVMPVFVLYVSRILPNLKKGFSRLQDLQSQLVHRMSELLQAATLIRAMGMEEQFKDRFVFVQEKFTETSQKNYDHSLKLTGMLEMINGLAMGLILIIGGWAVTQGQMSLGTLAAFYMYWLMLLGPVMRLGHLQGSFQEATSALGKIEDFLSRPKETRFVGSLSKPLQGHIRFENISFHYQNKELLLRQIDFEISPGSTAAIIGESGAGKTTLLKLMLRLYDPCRGAIRVDGHDLRKWNLQSYRHQIGMVLQDDYIFSGTIRENIVLGHPQASDNDIRVAAQAACAHEFIMQLPQGYNAHIGERGLTLSVGQRQRLALARALVRRPCLLVLDEATCALDALTENKVQNNIREFCPEATIITVAHRFSSIIDAQHIIVLDQGYVVQQGNHGNLVGQDGLYHKLYHEQFK